MVLTKKTILTFIRPDDVSESFKISAFPIIHDMVAQEKTDGLRIAIADNIIERHWVDQAAADEYIEHMIAIFKEHEIVITDITVSDYTP